MPKSPSERAAEARTAFCELLAHRNVERLWLHESLLSMVSTAEMINPVPAGIRVLTNHKSLADRNPQAFENIELMVWEQVRSGNAKPERIYEFVRLAVAEFKIDLPELHADDVEPHLRAENV